MVFRRWLARRDAHEPTSLLTSVAAYVPGEIRWCGAAWVKTSMGSLMNEHWSDWRREEGGELGEWMTVYIFWWNEGVQDARMRPMRLLVSS